MHPSRPLATTILLASLAIAGCGTRQAPTTGAAPAAPTPSASRGATATAPTTTSGSSTTTPASPEAPACASTRRWGTGPRQAAAYSSAPLYLVRAGRQACYDRVVFDVNGPAAVGYSVRYVDVVREDGSGTPRPVAGQAALEVVVHAPAQGFDDQGHQPGRLLARPGQDFYSAAQLAGWPTLRQVRFAGSFEGQTTIAVGVRARVGFRVFTLRDSRDQIRRVVLDLAR